MIYQYRPGYNAPISAQELGEQLDRIKNRDGQITPQAVVKEARKKNSPLHKCFDWDAKRAAQAYWVIQARRLIRSVDVIIRSEDPGEPAVKEIAYVSVGKAYQGGTSAYQPTREAMGNEEIRQHVLAVAKSQLEGWKRRYGRLQGTARIVAAIEDFLRDVPA